MEKKIFASVALACCCAGASAQTAPADSTQTAPSASDSIYRQMELGGVTVEGRTVIQDADHVSYVPTQKDVQASASGITLLSRLMIPMLTVNPIDGSVKGVDNKTPTICIDNRKASLTEANRLRPKDIVRVEYYDRPTARFPGEQSVLNFITKKYDRGGYVDLRTTTTFFSPSGYGKYEAQVAVDTKKLNVTTLAGATLRNEEYPGVTGTEHYGLATPFTKHTADMEKTLKSRNYYGMVRATYHTARTYMYADAGLDWTRMPSARTHTAVSYTGGAYAPSEATTDSRSRNITPSAAFFLQSAVSGNSVLSVQAAYSHGDNTYNRIYAEGAFEPVAYGADETSDKLSASVKYDINLRHNNSLTAYVKVGHVRSRATYEGTPDRQGVDDNSLLALLTYNHTFAQKLTLTAQAGPMWQSYRVLGATKTSLLFWQPNLTVNYAINRSNSVKASWGMISSPPFLAFFNNTEQWMSPYEVMRGNPHLKLRNCHSFYVTYNITAKNLFLALFCQGDVVMDNSKQVFLPEGETMVRTFVTDGTCGDYVAGASATLNLLNRSLRLTSQLYAVKHKITGINPESFSRVVFSLGGTYYIGNFAFDVRYNTKRMMAEAYGELSEAPQFYYFSASWSHKGWNIGASCSNIFDKYHKVHQWYDFGAYSYDKYVYANFNRSVGLNVSYSFDFGRKKVERTRLDVEKGASGIMKM